MRPLQTFLDVHSINTARATPSPFEATITMPDITLPNSVSFALTAFGLSFIAIAIIGQLRGVILSRSQRQALAALGVMCFLLGMLFYLQERRNPKVKCNEFGCTPPEQMASPGDVVKVQNVSPRLIVVFVIFVLPTGEERRLGSNSIPPHETTWLELSDIGEYIFEVEGHHDTRSRIRVVNQVRRRSRVTRTPTPTHTPTATPSMAATATSASAPLMPSPATQTPSVTHVAPPEPLAFPTEEPPPPPTSISLSTATRPRPRPPTDAPLPTSPPLTVPPPEGTVPTPPSKPTTSP